MEIKPELKLYSLEDVSQIVGLTHRTIWNYVKAGKLPAVKIGGKWKVSEENLKKFINGDS